MRSPWRAASTIGSATLALFFGWQWYRAVSDAKALRAELVATRALLAEQRQSVSTAPNPNTAIDSTASGSVKPAIGSSVSTAGAKAGSPQNAAPPEQAAKLGIEALIQLVVRAGMAANPNLPGDLGLTPEETREFLGLAMQPMQRVRSEMTPDDFAQMQKDPELARGFSERSKAAMKEGMDAAAARFGQQTVDRFKDQEFVEGARREVLQVQMVLVDKDVPLTAEQRQQLTKTLVNFERQLLSERQQAEAQTSAAKGAAAQSAIWNRYQTEREKRAAEAAKTVLTLEQQSIWSQHLANQRALRDAAQQFMRQQ